METDQINLRQPRLIGTTGRSVFAFFALACVLAWSLWLVLAGFADSAGLTTGVFVGRIEAGDFSVVNGSTPGWVLYLLTRGIDFSLSIAGLVMIGLTQGREGLRQLGRRLTRWRFSSFWYLLALAPVALYGAAALLASTQSGGSATLGFGALRTVLFGLSSGLFVSLFLRGALGEEIGLRGFVLPVLQKQMSPARATLILGPAWALWHLPALLEADLGSAIVFFLFVMGVSFLFTWIFNGSGGSLVPPLLLHATQNWEEGFEVVFPAIAGSDWEGPAVIGVLALSVVGVVAVVRSRGRSQLLETVQDELEAELELAVEAEG